MYYADYHTHSRLSPDSDAPLLDMAEAAARAGLSELCITDHYDLVEMDGPPRTQPLDWPAAVGWRGASSSSWAWSSEAPPMTTPPPGALWISLCLIL